MKRLKQLMRFAVPGVMAAAVFLTGMPASAMELVVFQASGTDLQPGQIVDGSAPLQLKDGQLVSLIAPNGQIIDLKGPYNQVPNLKAEIQEGVTASLKALVVAKRTDDSSFGVSRSATDVIKSAREKGWVPDPWLINVALSGNQCQRLGQPVVFWRPEKERTAKLTLKVGKDIWEAETNWPGGAEKLASPAELPLVDSEVYTVRLSDGDAVSFTLHLIPATVSTDGMRAGWMNAKGCDAQALALLSKL